MALCAVSLVFVASCGTSSYALRTREDGRISANAHDALRQAGLPARIEARSYHGVLALLGEVAADDERTRAETIVTAVEGVVRVNNLILVLGSDATAEGSSSSKRAPLIARAGAAPAP